MGKFFYIAHFFHIAHIDTHIDISKVSQLLTKELKTAYLKKTENLKVCENVVILID